MLNPIIVSFDSYRQGYAVHPARACGAQRFGAFRQGTACGVNVVHQQNTPARHLCRAAWGYGERA
jgi:hypothetical protein